MTQTQFLIMECIISAFLLAAIIMVIVQSKRIPGKRKLDKQLQAYTYFSHDLIRRGK